MAKTKLIFTSKTGTNQTIVIDLSKAERYVNDDEESDYDPETFAKEMNEYLREMFIEEFDYRYE